MGWNLTPEERRIIERTKRQGEELYSREPASWRGKMRLLKNVLVWIAVMLLFAVIATLAIYAGSLL